VPKHEQYAELSTLAMIGEASAAELKDLKEHLKQCADCRQEYVEFVQFVLPQLGLAADDQPLPMTAENRQAIRSDFLTKAASVGIHFSDEAIAGAGTSVKYPEPSLVRSSAWWKPPVRYALAAGFALVILVGAFLVGHTSMRTSALIPPNSSQTKLFVENRVQPSSNIIPDLAAAENHLSTLREQLTETNTRLETARLALDTSETERARLREEIEKQNRLLKEAEDQTQTSGEARSSLEAQLGKLQQKESALETDYANQTAAFVELAEQLKQQKAAADQQHQLASTDSEVHDLMASRNLHIVDVFDTDAHGKTKPIFGRVFFAENRQLVFYAYDLNEPQGRDSAIDYHVWGQKEGPGHSAKSLGMFRADDKTQHRWIFKSDDQQLLSQIDSIFVTVEKSDSPRIEPKGQKLMYAYLRDRPNHP
jgi:hypothetical protein